MTKENIKIIEKNIKMGHWVLMEMKDGPRKVFNHIDSDGVLQGLITKESKEKAIESCSCLDLRTLNEIEHVFTDNREIVTPKPLELEVGDRVGICDWYIQSPKNTFLRELVTEDNVSISEVRRDNYKLYIHPSSLQYVPKNAVYYKGPKLPMEEKRGIKKK